MVETLLTTKLNIPPIPSRVIRREQLIERLNQSAASKLVLISAPAGFGKTTLVSSWAKQASAAVTWLSLEPEDNDPARFLTYLIAAFQRVKPETGRDALSILQTPQPPSYQAVLTSLLNDLAAGPSSIALVLDDYHLIQADRVHQALIFLLDHLPEQAQLLLTTRADPPLPLPRLRARGQLTEFRQRDLRFTADEAAAFLNDAMGLALSANDISALETRTEGWIAGLQMAALSLQGQSPHPTSRAEFIHAFTGSHRFILDYLVEEVLEQQSPALQAFLLKTSILDQLTGSLCDAIMSDPDDQAPGTAAVHHPSQPILTNLEAANLFIVPLDNERQWYRYHRLFSDLLRKRLLQTYPDLVPALHQRASLWHEQQGLLTEAIDHALSAYDYERAGNLVEANVEETMMRSELTTFINWVEKLPSEWVRSRPTLCFYHAWALLMAGRSLDVVEQHLPDLACLQDPTPDSGEATAMRARITALRAYLMLVQVDIQRAIELGQKALDDLPENDQFMRGIVAWILSLAHLADGSLQEGKQALQELARMGQELGNPMIAVAALCHEATLQMRQGCLHQAQEIFEHALQLAADPQGRRLPVASEALFGLGTLALEWNQLETATDHLLDGIELAKQWSELAAFDGYRPLALVRLAQGDMPAAREALETARQIAYRSEITEIDDLAADLQYALLATIQGDFAEAWRWAEKRELISDGSPKPYRAGNEGRDLVSARLRKYEYLVLARLLMLQNQTTEALGILESLLAHARQLGRIDLIIKVQVLRALAFQAAGNDNQAMTAMTEILALTKAENYVRTFLDEGESMVKLLRQAASQGIEPDYVAELLATFSEPVSVEAQVQPAHPAVQPLIEPLSERELEVLQLLSAGLSNPEIADALFVAVSTVRSHCKSIYSKLNVHRRWDAVQRAQELGLI